MGDRWLGYRGLRLGNLRPRTTNGRPYSRRILLRQAVSRPVAQDACALQPGKGLHGGFCRSPGESGGRPFWPCANRGPALTPAPTPSNPAAAPPPPPPATTPPSPRTRFGPRPE